MTGDLISRSALLKKKTYLWDEAIGTEGCVLVEDIENAPTVDAEPVRHGEWEVTVCSLCRHDLDGWADGAHEEVADGNVHYCPNCGAKMDGGKE